jgi:hypothetical protein
MAKFYTISPQCVPENPHLFPMMRSTLIVQGHSFVDRIEDAKIIMVDLHTRIAPYNQSDVDYILNSNVPVSTFCEWDRGILSNDTYPTPLTNQQEKIFEQINSGKIKSVHFCRLLDKTKTYPPHLYPYEKPVLYEEPITTKDELFNREYDIVFVANHSPPRQAIADALLNDSRLRCYISLGQPKIPFDDFVKLHKRGKFFVSSGAGGYSNERPQYLFSIAAMIQEKTDQLLLHPHTDNNCLLISNTPTKDDLDRIYNTVNNKQSLYELYLSNQDFMKKYYSAEYIAADILNKIENHLCPITTD